jgi:hypothetical protein
MPDLVRFARTAAVWTLVAFHVVLFARRLAEPGALDATATLRWAGTFLIFGTALLLRARAARLTRRQWTALALAAIALHAPMLQGADEAQRAAGFLFALPGLLAPALAVVAVRAARLAAAGAAPACLAPAVRSAASCTPFSPRPPPLL